jgi:hypothetical protein
LTVILVTGSVLDTVNVTVTVAPVFTGSGVTLVTFTVGARGAETVSEIVPEPAEPLLSLAFTVIVKEPPEPYAWVSEVAVPGRVSNAVPSPQSTLKEEIVPSGSVAENVTVTVWPMRAGFGEMPLTVVAGGRSLTASEVLAELVEPPLSTALTVTVNDLLVEGPVEA